MKSQQTSQGVVLVSSVISLLNALLGPRLVFTLASLVALASVTHVASAAPMSTPFLGVDINGYNAGGGQIVGPTAAGFQGFEAAEGLFLPPGVDWGASGAAGLTNVYATTEGNITVNLKGVAPNSFLGARNRGANTGALSDLTQDFIFAQRNQEGFGQHYIKLTVSGLIPMQQYAITAFAREPFNGGTDSFQAWSDRVALGGLDGPGAYMDANFGAGSLYQPAPGGVNNPIPTLARAATSGADSVDPFAYAATFISTADAGGILEVYGWADPNSFAGTQTATLFNGFQIGYIPAPASSILIGLGLLGGLRTRRRFE